MAHHHLLADLYLRLSLDRDGKTAIERQEADCRAQAMRLGLEVRRVHLDRGRSGFKAVPRAGFEAAVSALKTGTVGTLIVWQVDRLSRRGMGEISAVLADADSVGGRIIFVQDGLDTSDSQSRQVLALLSEIARSESANLGMRVASAKAHLRSSGRWIGGRPPYGLTLTTKGRLGHDPSTAPIAREIAERALANEPLVHIVRDLNRRAIPSPRGGQWNVGTVSQLLKGPAFAGLLPETLKRDGRYTGTVVPWRNPRTGDVVEIGRGIVTPGEQLQIMRMIEQRAALDKSGQRRGVRAEVGHLLTGFLRCAGCGGRMSAAGLSYVCQGRRLGRPCPDYVSVYIAAADRAVFAEWTAKLASCEQDDALFSAVRERWIARYDPDVIRERTTIMTALDEAEAALNDLEEGRYLRGEFSGPDAAKRWTSLHERLTDRVEGLRNNLARFTLPDVDISYLFNPEQVTAAWQVATLGERRDLLSLALRRVTVLRGKRGQRFHPATRLHFAWTHETDPFDDGVHSG